jgi:hypothetical protein
MRRKKQKPPICIGGSEKLRAMDRPRYMNVPSPAPCHVNVAGVGKQSVWGLRIIACSSLLLLHHSRNSSIPKSGGQSPVCRPTVHNGIKAVRMFESTRNRIGKISCSMAGQSRKLQHYSLKENPAADSFGLRRLASEDTICLARQVGSMCLEGSENHGGHRDLRGNSADLSELVAQFLGGAVQGVLDGALSRIQDAGHRS